MYNEEAHSVIYHSLDHSIQIKIYMVGFIDDTSRSTNDFLEPHLLKETHYIQQATMDAQHWNDILQLSRVALQLTKCSYLFLFYQFSNTGIPYLSGTASDPIINLQFNDQTHPTRLMHLSAYESHKTLGVYKLQGGNLSKSC